MGDPVAAALMVVALVAWVVMTGTIIRQDRRNARKDREMDKEEQGRLVKLAKVGLRATIDEATGYQEVRSPTDLHDYAAGIGLDDVNAAIDARLRETGH